MLPLGGPGWDMPVVRPSGVFNSSPTRRKVWVQQQVLVRPDVVFMQRSHGLVSVFSFQSDVNKIYDNLNTLLISDGRLKTPKATSV